MGDRRHLSVQPLGICKVQGSNTCCIPHHLFYFSTPPFTGLSVSKTSSEKTRETGNVIITGVVHATVGGDVVGPRQVTQTEIFKSLFIREVGDGLFQDVFSGRIWLVGVPHII